MVSLRPDWQLKMDELAFPSDEELALASIPERDRSTKRRGGRPCIVLYPRVAAQMLQELAEGDSAVSVGRRYGVSRYWIYEALADGRLNVMAAGKAGKPNHPKL